MSQYPPKGNADFLKLGDWNADCFFCGKKYKASELKKHWQGFYLCSSCWEPRHPQDFVRGVPDKPAAPWVQTTGETIAPLGDALTTDDGAGSDTVPPDLLMTDTYRVLTTDEG